MISSTFRLYKNAYKGLSRNTWWLSFVMLINRSGTMVVPFMTMYLTQHVGVGIGKAGMVMSIFGAGSIVGALAGGKITDRIGYYYVQIFTLVGGGIMFIVLGQIQSYPLICVTTFFLSMVNEAFRPANAVAIAHYSKEENRTRSYSLNRLAVNLGWAFGGGLGGILAAHNYQSLFWVDGITNIVAAILLYIVLAPSKNIATQQKKKTVAKQSSSVFKDSPFIFFICLQVLFALCFFQMFTTLPVYYKTQLHLSETFIGINMAFNGIIIALVEMVIVFKLEGRRPLLYYIATGVLLIGVSFCILNIPVANTALLALAAMFIITLGEMLSLPFMNTYWIERTNNDNRGQYAGLNTVAWSIAQILGPFLGTQIVEHFGYSMLWWAIGAVSAILCVVYIQLQRNS